MKETSVKKFSEIDAVCLVFRTIIDNKEPDWIPQKDSNFIKFLDKEGLLDAWEEVFGKVAKKYKPKTKKQK